jgi:hypothetical protein
MMRPTPLPTLFPNFTRPGALRARIPALAVTLATAGALLSGAAPANAADPPTSTTPAPAAADPRITDAEKRLFMTDHLANVAAGRTLAYRYERRGSLEPAADDEATLTLQMADGKRSSTVDFLHGDRRIELPPITDVEGNPILLHFLEREIREFSRLTGGSRTYYRKRIRMALAADPPVSRIRIDRGGRSLDGFEIRVDPYVDDPARSRYERFAARRYTLVLSPDIPGEIYQLRAELPATATAGTAGPALQTEVLTYEGER